MGILTMSINGYCNLACEFCYQKLDNSELSLGKVLSHVKPGQDIEIDGGEPLLHPQFLALANTLGQMNRHVHVSTNGTYISRGFLSLEDEIRKNIEIQVSLHASNKGLYELITRRNAFDLVIANIDRLKDKYSTGLSCAVYEKNFDDVPNIADLAKKMDLPLRVNLVFPINNDVKLLDSKQIGQLKGYLLSRKISGDKIDSPLLHENNCEALHMHYGMEKKGRCPADCQKKYVSPRGEVRACEFLGE